MQVLTKPILTEKAAQLTEQQGRFVFKVDHRANKIQIKTAVEEMYGVTVVAVNTMKYVGKLKSRNTKAGIVSGRIATYKKAVITLKDGESIDFYNTL